MLRIVVRGVEWIHLVEEMAQLLFLANKILKNPIS
jgi:hypothetical protein